MQIVGQPSYESLGDIKIGFGNDNRVLFCAAGAGWVSAVFTTAIVAGAGASSHSAPAGPGLAISSSACPESDWTSRNLSNKK